MKEIAQSIITSSLIICILVLAGAGIWTNYNIAHQRCIAFGADELPVLKEKVK